MENVTLFFWAREVKNTFSNGAKIHFHSDRSVSYANLLMPPGQAIHQWDSFGQLVSLPLLDARTRYHFILAGVTAPDKMFTQVEYFDRAEQVIGKDVFDGIEGDIQLPEGAINYRLSLMNIRQTGTEFQYGLLSSAPLISKMAVSVNLQAGMMNVNLDQKATTQDLVIIANRFGAVSVPVAMDRSTVVLFAAPTQGQLKQLQVKLQPDIPIRMRVLGTGLVAWGNTVHQSLQSQFTFLDSEVAE
ncbi:accessory Sec system protein Asp3 [Schleiferilactobacillus perolens]|jgi:accessory Sec system protein Asp3|uniref:accessory Sec system protein Asp3 n=1 Tax=Schleiferilactobacillus perolens TaxID=100468 RepID=UPI0023562FC9|nr:accessory Sec system protein Asp3 [Schleiferilactobacillus perolens]MCI2172283.1 accessory Sec system protein Asp3 [Schleiferilactobacillus perolens]